MPVLSPEELAAFDRNGFVHLSGAFPRQVAAACCAHLWTRIDPSPDDPSTWTQPSVRSFDHVHPAFADAARSPRLIEAIAEVFGPDVVPPAILSGSSVVRFPVPGDPGDDGWHVDAAFLGPSGRWHVNHRATGRAALLLVLLTETGPDDAPTRLRARSHHRVPELLAPYGEEGIDGLAFQPPASLDDLPVALATGEAGDVYLCHPHLVHAAQRHHGSAPRILAQSGAEWRPGVTGLDEATPPPR